MSGRRFFTISSITLLRAQRLRGALLVLLLGAAGSLGAQPAGPVPAWMQPEVLVAAAAMNMTDAQQAQFRTIVGEFATARLSVISKVVRRGGANQPRKIRSKTRSLLKQMDKKMSKMLTEEQGPAYAKYLATFKSYLDG